MNNALYFPYISLPQTPWLIQTLLYWDKIASIVPQEFVEAPERLQPHMRQLINDGAITLIQPSDYIWRIPDFEENFIKIIDSKPKYFWQPRQGYSYSAKKAEIQRVHTEKLTGYAAKKETYSSIHAEKLTPLVDELLQRGIAYRGDNNWYYVPQQVASYFMTYLAIGISDVANYRPISDDYTGLSAFASSSFCGMPTTRTRLRARVLEEILPSPTIVEDFNDIYRFKEEYNEQLKGFKRHIERFLASISQLPYQEAKELVDDFIEECREEKEELARRMEERNLRGIGFNTWTSVCASVTSVVGGYVLGNPYTASSGTMSLASQLWSVFRSHNNDITRLPMAYSVYVQKKFNNFSKH